MRVLVTGGTGFVGSNLAARLLADGHDVLITGNDTEQSIPGFRGKCLHPGLLGIDWDAIGALDVLFHQAAINDTTLLDEREMKRANVQAAGELFRRAVAGGCRRIVYASSTAVYGDAPAPYREDATPLNPLNPYGCSKLHLEQFGTRFAAEHPEVTVVGLRYCNVYGPGESHKGKRASMIYQLARQMRTGNPRLFKYGEQKRDYLYVADAVRANLLAAQARESCIVNCGSGGALSFNELVRLLNETLSLQRAPQYFPNPYADRYQSHTECNMEIAQEKLGFIPEYDIRKGLQHYFRSGSLG